MSLRRPPTRIELKSDDIEEYEQVRWSSYRLVVVFLTGKFALLTILDYAFLAQQLKREKGTSDGGSGFVLGGAERTNSAAIRIGLRRSKIVARKSVPPNARYPPPSAP